MFLFIFFDADPTGLVGSIQNGSWASGWMDASAGESSRPYRETQPGVAAAAAALARALASASNRAGRKVFPPGRPVASSVASAVASSVAPAVDPEFDPEVACLIPRPVCSIPLPVKMLEDEEEASVDAEAAPVVVVAVDAYETPAGPAHDPISTYTTVTNATTECGPQEPAHDLAPGFITSTPAVKRGAEDGAQAVPAGEVARGRGATGLTPFGRLCSYTDTSSTPHELVNETSGYNDFLMGLQRGVAKQAALQRSYGKYMPKQTILLPSGIQARVEADVHHMIQALKSIETPVSYKFISNTWFHILLKRPT